MKERMEALNIPLKKIGKVLVINSKSDIAKMNVLYEQGIKNLVQLEILPAKDLPKFEPLARTVEAFLWSPTTAIGSPTKTLNRLASYFTSLGGELHVGTRVISTSINNEIKLKSGTFHFDFMFNAAGTSALMIAKQRNLGSAYQMLPMRGDYIQCSVENLPLQRLVYKLPHESNAFLSSHLTPTTDGFIKVGPTAWTTFARPGNESLRERTSVGLDSITTFTNYVLHNKKQALSLGSEQLKRKILGNILREVDWMVPSVRGDLKWAKSNFGIRPQLIHKQNGKLVSDFIIEKDSNSIHVLNAVSPAWTASFAFARYCVDAAKL